MPVGVILGGLMALMGIGPLSSWTFASIKSISKAIWKPAIPAAALLVVLLILGMRNWVALTGFALIAFVICVSMYEYWRAARGRQRMQGESLPLAFWRLFQRNRRRYGGYLVHMAMVIMAVGILGIEVFQTTTQRSLAVGESIELAGYSLRFDSLELFRTEDERWVTQAKLSVFSDGEYLGELLPRYDVYPDGQPMTVPAVRSTLADDIYVVLINWEGITRVEAPFKIYHNPLVIWLWIGSVIFIAGMLVTSWPEKESGEG
jgi:cytochrome c-type biogenesis protein CcmF